MPTKPFTVSRKERKAISRAFPLLAEIQDADLREQVIKAWALAWRQSSYKALEDVPQALGHPFDTLVRHTNAAASGALALGQQMNEEYGLHLNLDHIMAGALLHDVDKIVMLDGKGDKTAYSKVGKQILHGAYGAHLALQAGVCLEVAHIIMTHTPLVNLKPQSPEGILVSAVEHTKLHALAAALGEKV